MWRNKKIERKKLPWQELDGKIVILSSENSMSHELNETASWIWKEIEMKIKFDDLLINLLNEFSVEEQIAKMHLEEILTSFNDNKLINV